FCTPPKDVFRDKIFKDIISVLKGNDNELLTEFKTSIIEDANIKDILRSTFQQLDASYYSKLTLEELLELRTKQHVYSLETALNYTWPMLVTDKPDLDILNHKSSIKIDSH